MSKFSTILNKKMQERHLSQKTLATRIGMSPCVISTYVNGKSTPTLYTLDKLCRELKTTPNELLGYEAPVPAGFISKNALSFEVQEKNVTKQKLDDANKLICDIQIHCMQGKRFAEDSLNKFSFLNRNDENRAVCEAALKAYEQILKMIDGACDENTPDEE